VNTSPHAVRLLIIYLSLSLAGILAGHPSGADMLREAGISDNLKKPEFNRLHKK